MATDERDEFTPDLFRHGGIDCMLRADLWAAGKGEIIGVRNSIRSALRFGHKRLGRLRHVYSHANPSDARVGLVFGRLDQGDCGRRNRRSARKIVTLSALAGIRTKHVVEVM